MLICDYGFVFQNIRKLCQLKLFILYFFTQEHILRQNLYEVCALSEKTGGSHQGFYALDSSICHRIKQEQQRRQQSPYSAVGSRKSQKTTTTFMSSQDQLKLPLCAFLPVQSNGKANNIKTSACFMLAFPVLGSLLQLALVFVDV